MLQGFGPDVTCPGFLFLAAWGALPGTRGDALFKAVARFSSRTGQIARSERKRREGEPFCRAIRRQAVADAYPAVVLKRVDPSALFRRRPLM
jgi:hypothetical protein